MAGPMTETHTGCYRDVADVPVEVMASVASYVSREYGDYCYRIGYVARAWDETTKSDVHVFQVKHADGSRFAVGTTRWGEPFELEGNAWLAFLQDHQIEATLRGCS